MLMSIGRFLLVLGMAAGMQDVIIDMEDIAMDSIPAHMIFPRSNARSNQTMLLTVGQSVVINLCLAEEQQFLIKRIVYSTDGWPDQVQVLLDGVEVGKFQTHSGTNWGHLWNEFHFTGSFGTPMILSGRHSVRISLLVADFYGVELDYVTFGFSTSSSVDQILCPEHDYAIQRALNTILVA